MLTSCSIELINETSECVSVSEEYSLKLEQIILENNLRLEGDLINTYGEFDRVHVRKIVLGCVENYDIIEEKAKLLKTKRLALE